eukprot:SAG11_NODE_5966_length_1423_cov_2.186556_1_plen_436_part_01
MRLKAKIRQKIAFGGARAPTLVIVTSLDYSNQDLGPGEMMLISALIIPTTVGLAEVVTGPKSTRVPFNNSEVTTLDFSDQGLGPADIMLISAAIPTIPGLVEVVISGNNCLFGTKSKYSDGSGEQVPSPDRDQTGWCALCAAFKGSSIQKIGIADIGLGPVGMKTLAETIPTIPGLAEVVTGPKLTRVPFNNSEVTTLDFSDRGLGPAEIMLISAAIPTIPGLVGMNISKNDIGTEGALALAGALPSSRVQALLLGAGAPPLALPIGHDESDNRLKTEHLLPDDLATLTTGDLVLLHRFHSAALGLFDAMVSGAATAQQAAAVEALSALGGAAAAPHAPGLTAVAASTGHKWGSDGQKAQKGAAELLARIGGAEVVAALGGDDAAARTLCATSLAALKGGDSSPLAPQAKAALELISAPDAPPLAAAALAAAFFPA